MLLVVRIAVTDKLKMREVLISDLSKRETQIVKYQIYTGVIQCSV